MDPLSLIVAALAAGATAALKDTASQAIKDSYQGLKALVKRKFEGRPDAEIALARHEQKPEVWEAPLKDVLVEAGVESDREIIAAAQQLMALLEPQQAALGKYNVQVVGNIEGFAQGDNQQVTMNFGVKSEDQ